MLVIEYSRNDEKLYVFMFWIFFGLVFSLVGTYYMLFFKRNF